MLWIRLHCTWIILSRVLSLIEFFFLLAFCCCCFSASPFTCVYFVVECISFRLKVQINSEMVFSTKFDNNQWRDCSDKIYKVNTDWKNSLILVFFHLQIYLYPYFLWNIFENISFMFIIQLKLTRRYSLAFSIKI